MHAQSRMEARGLKRVQGGRDELAERITRLVTKDGSLEAAPGLDLFRYSSPTGPVYAVNEPSFCIIVQGSKELLLGKERFRYDASRYLLVSAGLPVIGRILEGTKERPYLAVRIGFDCGIVTTALMETGLLAPRVSRSIKAIAVSRLDANLLDGVVRLLRLVDAPRDYSALAPLAIREIVYRLALGEQGGRLCQIVLSAGRTHRIAKAIALVRKGYDKPLRIPSLARQLGMSTSGLHHHFKAVTAMSPLQFQSSFGYRKPGDSSLPAISTPRPLDTGSATTMRRSSAGSTSGSSASRRCATSSGCEAVRPAAFPAILAVCSTAHAERRPDAAFADALGVGSAARVRVGTYGRVHQPLDRSSFAVMLRAAWLRSEGWLHRSPCAGVLWYPESGRYDRMMISVPAMIVYACWGVFAITWVIAAWFVKRTVERRWGWGRLLMILVALVAYSTVRDPALLGARRLWTPTPSGEWLAAAIVLLGLSVTLWARLALGRNWSGAVTFKQDHELIERGPYRYVRHPIYTGILTMALGTAMLHLWASAFVLVGIMAISFWVKLRAEERLLTRHFPDEYPRYRRRVRALIPFVL